MGVGDGPPASLVPPHPIPIRCKYVFECQLFGPASLHFSDSSLHHTLPQEQHSDKCFCDNLHHQSTGKVSEMRLRHNLRTFISELKLNPAV